MAKLTIQQQTAIDCRGKELIVSAAAGAGKTTVLVNRIGDLICDENCPVDIDRLLVVTYTNAAASEMRGRIAETISARLEDMPQNRRLRRQLALLQSASIQTVHSFCQSIIRQNFAQAGVAPDFTLADEALAQQLRERAMEEMLEQEYAENRAEFDALRRNICEERGDFRLQQAILIIYERLRSHPTPQKWLDFVANRQPVAPELTGWGREILKSARNMLDYAEASLARSHERLNEDAGLCEKYAPAFEQCLTFARALRHALSLGWDETARALAGFEKPELGRRPSGSDADFAAKMKAARDDFASQIQEIRKSGLMQLSDAILSEQKREIPLIAELCRLIGRFSSEFSRVKEEKNVLDFSDLEHIALALLQDESGEPSVLARELSEQFCEVLVDEYQDTNEIQERIFRSIIGKRGSAFFVGDVKQSIYRFRLADPTIFLDRLDTSEDLPTESPRARLALSDNFRSLPPVIDICNHVFSRIMSRKFGDIDYECGHRLTAGRTENTGGGELWIVDTDELSAGEEESEQAVEMEARLAGARIVAALENEHVVEPGGVIRAARPSDFAILLSSFDNKAQYFAQELRRANVPVQSPEDDDLFSGVEMTVVLSLLRIIDNPRQDVPLISVLRSPLFLFDSDDLAEVRLRAPDGDFFAAVRKAAKQGHEKSARFLDGLIALRNAARDMTVSELVRKMLRETNAAAVFSALEGGKARERNLSTLYQMALAFESDGARGLAAFLRHIDAKIAAGTQPAVPASGDGVRIMSIHKSKGLEFPFVVLPDLNKRFNTDDAKGNTLFHQHMGLAVTLREPRLRAEFKTAGHTAIASRIRREGFCEEMRKLYVAMTRAKQRLIMIMSRTKAQQKLQAWEDEAGEHINPEFLASQASAMPWICTALLDYPGMCTTDGTQNSENPYFFGKIISWRDIESARWSAQPVASPAARDEKDEYAQALELAALEYQHEAASRLPSKLTPTGVKRLMPGAAEIESEQGAPRVRMFRRPPLDAEQSLSSAERGTAMHIFLRHTDLRVCLNEHDVREEVLRVAMLGHLSPEEAQSIVPAQICALARSDLAKRIQNANERIHEYEFSALFAPDELLGNGIHNEKIMLNGAIDLLLFTDDGIEIVDFKSDSILPGFEARQAEKHRLQIVLYAAAAERIFVQSVARRTIWFTVTGAEASLG